MPEESNLRFLYIKGKVTQMVTVQKHKMNNLRRQSVSKNIRSKRALLSYLE